MAEEKVLFVLHGPIWAFAPLTLSVGSYSHIMLTVSDKYTQQVPPRPCLQESD